LVFGVGGARGGSLASGCAFECGGGLAGGLDCLWGFGGSLRCACQGFEGGGAGFGCDEFGSCGVDLGHRDFELLVLGRADEGGELGEGAVVEVAEVKGGECAVEEIAGELGGEGEREDVVG